jgi:hypothetical protein
VRGYMKFSKCDVCFDIILRDEFYGPQDYLNCLDYISELSSGKGFKITYQTCDIKDVKKENDCWVNDIIQHRIKCRKCGRSYTAFCDTYHGSGGFRKGK